MSGNTSTQRDRMSASESASETRDSRPETRDPRPETQNPKLRLKSNHNIVVLSGGVGGAKLVDGLYQILPPESLSVIANTADDFEHWGLWISPDLDTLMYTLAEVVHPEQGWGLRDDSFTTLNVMRELGEAAWFKLGDRDLATHLFRTQLLRSGESLTQITQTLCQRFGVKSALLPMCNAPRSMIIETLSGTELPFQHWLVKERAALAVARVRLKGSTTPTQEVLDAIEEADLILIAPSNPYVSIDPILGLTGVKERIAQRPVVAVSPLIAGQAVKGPLANMVESIEKKPPSATAIAEHYAPLLKGFVIDRKDEPKLDIPVLQTKILMKDRKDRVELATRVLEFAERL